LGSEAGANRQAKRRDLASDRIGDRRLLQTCSVRRVGVFYVALHSSLSSFLYAAIGGFVGCTSGSVATIPIASPTLRETTVIRRDVVLDRPRDAY
jgi:hypothetical protein